MKTAVIFKPRSSNGWLWLTLIGLFVFTIAILPIISRIGDLQNVRLQFGQVISGVIGICALVLAVLFFTIRYELRDTELALRYGLWTLYRIRYQDIRKVSWQDLSISPVSSFRLPGFALFNVPYNDIGIVKMVATSAATRILIIRTNKHQYGITPADEENLIACLMERVKG